VFILADFLHTIQKKVLIGDGAMGTMLYKLGLGYDESPELWMLAHPNELKSVHFSYLEAGAQIIQTNTFGANRIKLSEYGAEHRVREINSMAVHIVREAVGDKAFIAGIIGPSGHFPFPLGDIEWTVLADAFEEQAQALAEAGVDFIFLETFSDLGEIRAALLAAKKVTSLPVACSMTYTGGRTLTGTTPAVAAAVLGPLGADLIGANCSTGPKDLLKIMQEYSIATDLPLLVEPNAGLPELINNIPVYNETPEKFAAYVEPFRQAGASLIASCCGSTPEYTKAMRKALASTTPALRTGIKQSAVLTASRSKIVMIGSSSLPVIIGERINPTARKSISDAFKENNWETIAQEGFLQVDSGAHMLDLNVGVPGSDESELLRTGVRKLQMSLDIPLVLDCINPHALEKGLQEFQGRALINSVNGEEKSLRSILPLAKKYGAAVLGLCLDEKGIPEKAEDRLLIAERIVREAQEYGLKKSDVLIDCLVLTAAASPELSMETPRAISMVKEKLGVGTVLGLSNVSHGLPQRSWLNAAFLSICIGAGLDAAITNPSDSRIQETLVSAALLAGRDPGANNYIYRSGSQPQMIPSEKEDSVLEPTFEKLNDLIYNGRQDSLTNLLTELIKNHSMLEIVNNGILPPLEKIGKLFASGEVFLPQLILSGDSAKAAFAFLKESFPGTALRTKATVVIGTVRGDVHDIGKNIVAALLENHGYRVVDLGKNVPAEEFLAAAIDENAQIVGLSALMTTTMTEMKPVIRLLRQECPAVKIIIGGAVLTEQFAKEIDADGYGKNAVEAVALVDSLLRQT